MEFKQADIVILTMLRKVELSAIENVFKQKWPDAAYETLPGSTLFFRASTNNDWNPTIALRCINGAGNLNAAAETTNMLSRFRPRFAFLCGIAGNLNHDKADLGDVIFGDGVTFRQYTRISEGRDLSSTEPTVDGFSQHMRDVLHRIVGDLRTDLNGPVAQAVSGSNAAHQNKIRTGKIFCWDMVLDCNETRLEIAKQDRELRAVEMEAAGFFKAIDSFKRLLRTPETDFPIDGMIVRGLSDPACGKVLSDSDNVNWRALAARNSALALADFIFEMQEHDCLASGF